jgi:hypothetical protein
MATKTWKLGELCQGGIITVQTNPNTVTIIGKEWDMSQGTRRGSNQSNAKEFSRRRFDVSHSPSSAEFEMDEELNRLTTSYHADQILTWIKTKVDLRKRW